MSCSAKAAMKRLRRSIRRHGDDERGAVLILVAMSLTVIIAASGFSVDLGRIIVVNRSLQTVADASALDAARYLDTADSLTTEGQAALTENGSQATETVTGGLWAGGTFTPKTGIFCAPGKPFFNASCNAVKVVATSSIGNLFSQGGSTLHRSAIAATSPEASFSIGTYLAGVTTGNTYSNPQLWVLNALLGALESPPLTTLNLTAVGFSGLANTDVTIAQLIAFSGGVLTPANVMTTSLTAAGWVTLLQDAASSQAGSTCNNTPTPFPCTANSTLSTLPVNASTSATLCQLISVNGSSCSNPSLSQLSLNASINILQLLTTEAELAVVNGTNALSIPLLSASLPGVASASFTFTAIQAPQVAFGPVSPSTTASASQVSLKLVLTLAGGLGTLTIPISGANGQATLSGMRCVNNSATQVTIAASTTTATGGVTFSGLPGVTVATLSASGASPPSLPFTIIPPTTASIRANTNPVTFAATTPGFSFSGVSGLLNLVAATLLGPVSALTSNLGPIVQALGVSVAGAQVAVLGADCAAVSLVQ
jgi:uncharacterized membrane protein